MCGLQGTGDTAGKVRPSLCVWSTARVCVCVVCVRGEQASALCVWVRLWWLPFHDVIMSRGSVWPGRDFLLEGP